MSVVDNAIYIDGKRAVVPIRSTRPSRPCTPAPRAATASAGSACCVPTRRRSGRSPKEFNLHSLSVEDTINAHQRPKLEQYGDVLFVVLRPARYVDRRRTSRSARSTCSSGPTSSSRCGTPRSPTSARCVTGWRPTRSCCARAVRRSLRGAGQGRRRLRAGHGRAAERHRRDRGAGLRRRPDVSRRIYQLSREVIDFQRAVDPLATSSTRCAPPSNSAPRAPTWSCAATCATSPTTPRG